MALIRGRTALAAVMVGLIGGASGAAGAAVVGRPAQVAPAAVSPTASAAVPARAAAAPPLVLKGCADKKTGVVSVIGLGTRNKRCASGEVAVRFTPPAVVQPSILESDGSLRLSSPDGRFQLVLSNAGVGMRGPGGQVSVDQLRVQQIDRSKPVGQQ